MPRYQWVRSHISSLEEKERTRRLNDPDESFAIINAFALSELIRDLGLGFCIFFYIVIITIIQKILKFKFDGGQIDKLEPSTNPTPPLQQPC